MVGRTVAHYRVTKALGRGGMGAVYLAEDLRLKRLVALKFLSDELTRDADRLERFEREAQIVAALNHPNIVTMHSIERDGDMPFMAMEYLEGKTLDEIVPRSGLPLKRLLPLATQIVDAAVAAHGHGVVHRDLKPGNVMVLPGDRVKVLDFGVAKLREPQETSATVPTRELTGEGKIVGTVAYMSPEQAEGAQVDARSDIFAIGVMLYQMATGERPFTGDSNLSVLSSILRDAPKPVTELNPVLPRDVWRIVRHCLAKDPDRRYQTAKDLRNDLDDLAQSLTSGEVAAAEHVAPASRRGARRSTMLVLGIVGVALVAAWQWRGARSRADALPPSLSHSRLTQRAGLERWPSISPDGGWVVYVAEGDIYLQSVTGQTAINLTKDSASDDAIDEASGITEGEPQPLATPAWYVGDFSLSADGNAAVYSSLTSTNNLARAAFDPKTSTIKGEVEMITTGTNDFFQFDVTRDGKFAAVSTTSRTREDLYVLTVADGSVRQLTNDFARDRWPRWSPDGSAIYFYSDRQGYDIWRINADGAGLRRMTNVPGLKQMYPSISPDGTKLAASDQDVRKLAIYDTRDFTRPVQVITAPVDAKIGALQVHDWSPDGRSFLVAALPPGAPPSMWSYTQETGAARRVTECAAAWTTDGRRIVCIRSGRLVSVDASSGQTTELLRGGLTPGGGVRLAADDSQIFFLRDSSAADIWVTRFGQPAKPQ